MSTLSNETHASLLKKARTALSQKDLEAARSFLSAAKSLNGETFSPIIALTEAEITYEAGDIDSAEAQLEALLDQKPDYFWAAFHLTRLARERGALELAKARLLAVRACDANDENRAVWALRVEIAQDLSELTKARRILNNMAEVFPDDPWPWERLAVQDQNAGDIDAALASFEEALKREPGNRKLALQRARCAYRAQRLSVAEEAYRDLIDAFGPEPDTIVMLAMIYRRQQDTAREIEVLLTGLTSFPHSYALWSHVFNFHSDEASERMLNQTIQMLREHTKTPKVDFLELKSTISSHNYEAAFALCRKLGPRVEEPAQALDRAKILFGLERYQMALRYLRLCLRRWPDSAALLNTLVIRGLKLGQNKMVSRTIAPLQQHHNLENQGQNKLLLAGFANDLDAATEAYRELRKMGKLRQQDRELMCKLIAMRAPIGAINSLFEEIGNPLHEMGKLAHRSGVAGQLMLEYEIESRDADSPLTHKDTSAWMRSRPGSTLAAIRLVDQWSSLPSSRSARTAPVPGNGPVPRKIYQYWHDPKPPVPIRKMVHSWAEACGFEHSLMDRNAALLFLNETGNPKWPQAFRLAANHAEESDFFRLCMLAENGGLYADADDVLYGQLEQALQPMNGLILYREMMGGAVGNNFLAAPAGHPVIVTAADMACEVLLQRSAELSWAKTGPGLLTRALGHYLATTDPNAAAQTITLLEWGQIERCIAMHNRLNYKEKSGYWLKESRRNSWKMPLWMGVKDVLSGIAEPAAQ